MHARAGEGLGKGKTGKGGGEFASVRKMCLEGV